MADIQNGQCTGVMSDALPLIMAQAKLNYTVILVNTSSFQALANGRPKCPKPVAGFTSWVPDSCISSSTDIPSVMFHFPERDQPFDIGMSFSFASADRLQIIDASLPILDTYNANTIPNPFPRK